MVGPGSVDHTCNICLDTLGANGGVSSLLCGGYLLPVDLAYSFQSQCTLQADSVMRIAYNVHNTLIAGHPFCRECLARWQATSHLCPVCRADQRTLAGNSASSPVPGLDEPDAVQGPSLATVLGLLGQLAVRGAGPGVSASHSHSSSQDGSGMTFSWGSQPATANTAPPEASSAVITDLQSSVQFVMTRIESLDRRPLYWNAQISELQQASSQLDACRQGAVSNSAQVVQHIQQYTDTVNAQLDEFLTQSEARAQHQQAQAQQPHTASYSGSSQPSAPRYASVPPPASTAAHNRPHAPTNASGGGGWSWKWGWGPPPAGTLPEDPESATATQAQQASGIGAGTAAAAAAAAFTKVAAAAAAAYRKMTATTTVDAQTSDSSEAASQAQHQSAAGHASSSQGQQGRTSASSGTASGSSAAPSAAAGPAPASGPPVQGMYEAVRSIFDQHVTPDSNLGRWGEVAHHLNDLHGQINAGDSQRQDTSRLLASAVNAYSAYRRATASSANP